MFLLKLTFTHWHIVKRRFYMVVRPYNPSSHIKVNLSNQQRFLLLILKVTLIWISSLGAYFADDFKTL